jgi:hypothetical protein
VTVRAWTFFCRACGCRVVQMGGRRRRFCDDCLRLIASTFRRIRRRRFPRRLLGVRGPR